MSTEKESAQLAEWDDQKSFILAGDAVFTLVSTETDTRYTFRIQQPKPRGDEDVSNKWFAKLLAGPDNIRDFQYCGMLLRDGGAFKYIVTKAAKLARDTAPQKALAWIAMHLDADRPFPAGLEFWHVGRCGRCGRALTVPASIASGLGPVCAAKD
jgi:hypothetical protein